MMRAVIIVTVALVALSISAAVASARPWVSEYPWNTPGSAGFEGWSLNDTNPDGGPQDTWYEGFLGNAPFGPGVAAHPTGGKEYPSAEPTRLDAGPRMRILWRAPGNSTITRARFSDGVLSSQPGDGQYLRARVYGQSEDQWATRDYGEAYGQPERAQPHKVGPVTLAPRAPGTTVEGWLFTTCRPDPASPGRYNCPNINRENDSYGRWGNIRIELDDPDNPNLEVSGDPPIDDGWSNRQGTQRITINATDRSSGIAGLRVEVQTGQRRRIIAERRVQCDPTHRAQGRNGLVCPAEITEQVTDPGQDTGQRDRRYTITVTDYAGNTTERALTLRRDLGKPSRGRITGDLARLARGWTNYEGPIDTVIRAADARSGVERVEIIARRQQDGSEHILTTATPDCRRSGCRSITERVQTSLTRDTIPKDGRYQLLLRVNDRAGNTRTFKTGRTLRIDRTPPDQTTTTPFYKPLKNGRVKLYLDPGRDQDSGFGEFIIRYTDTQTNQPRTHRATLNQTSTETLRRTRYRTITLTRADPTRPITTANGGCDRATGRNARKEYGGSTANCGPYIALKSSSSKITADSIEAELFRELRLKNLDREAYELYRKAQQNKARKLTARISKFRVLARLGTIAGIIEPLVNPDNTSCYSDPNASRYIIEGSSPELRLVTERLRIVRTSRTLTPESRATQVAYARRDLRSVQKTLDRFYTRKISKNKDCTAYAVAVRRIHDRLANIINTQTFALLIGRLAQKAGDTAKAALVRYLAYLQALKINDQPQRSGQRRCSDSKNPDFQGKNDRSWIVYWTPPPTPPKPEDPDRVQ